MFFFCKQKTAYELRISDWSSDVCSSDLGSIEELAGLLNIEPATLRASIERFNGFVRQNRDDDFHRGERAYDRWLGDWLNKPSETLGCIEQGPFHAVPVVPGDRSEAHTSELQSLMRISYAVFCLKKKTLPRTLVVRSIN